MKKICYSLIFVLFGLTLKAQVNNVDSLIQSINNDQLYGTCHYAWVLEMNSNAGDSLIKIGNSVKDKLISILDKKDKGIIAHYILVNISGIPYMQTSSFEHFEADTILDYYYADLRFQEKNGHFFAPDSVLSRNKEKWIEGNFIDPLYINYDSLFNDKNDFDTNEIIK